MPFWNPLFLKPEVKYKEYLFNSPENYTSIANMIKLQNKLIDIEGNIEINLDNCSTLSVTNVMILSSIQLIRKYNHKGTILSFEKNTKLLDQLMETNTITGKKNKNFNMEPKPYKTEKEILIILNEIKQSSKFISIIKEERNTLISKIYELLINSLEHGENNIGAICHCFYKKQTFNFSIYDFGVGIPKKVRNYLKDESINDIDTIAWALTSTNSTKITKNYDFPGGSGLKLIEKLISKYSGKLIICSGNAYYLIRGQKTITKTLPQQIRGTLITLSIPINIQK